MVEDSSGAFEPSEVEEPKEATPKRGLSTRAIVAIAMAVVLVAGGAFWALSWLSTSGERDIASQRQALAENWKKAQADEAPGVDFELKISNGEAPGKPSLSFDHEGMATAKDSCFEATSAYIVREDGSLAVEDLSNSWESGEDAACSEAKAGPIFWTSTVSFNMETYGWTAYDAAGKPLVSELKEKRPAVTLETDDDSGNSEDTP